MNRKLKKLQKALSELGIDSNWDKFDDDSDEWLEIQGMGKKGRVDIIISSDGKIGVYLNKIRTIVDEDNAEKIL